MTNKAFLVDANGQVIKATGKTLDSVTGLDSLATLTAAQGAAGGNGAAAIVTLDTTGTSAATANTVLIQKALAAAGVIRFEGAGTAYINATLTLLSNSYVSFAPGLKIKQAPGSNVRLLQTQAMVDYLAGGTSISLAWSAGVTAAVTWTAHGFTGGEVVWLSGGTPTVFIGLFRVHSVSDANTFTVKLRYLPASAPSGTWVGVVATRNVHIRGGDFDYDSTNNPSGTGLNKHSLYFGGLADSTVKGVRSSNALKYAFCSAATLGVRFYDLTVPYNTSDGFKMYGPCFDTHVFGIRGRTGDDGATIQGKEAAPYVAYQLALGGDAIDCSIRDVDIESENATVMVAGVYLSDSEWTTGILIDGLFGSSPGSCCRIEAGSGFTVGRFGKITVRRHGAVGPYGITTGRCDGNSLSIEDPMLALNSVTTGPWFDYGSTSTIRSLVVDRPDWTEDQFPNGGSYFMVQISGVCDQATVRNASQKNLGSSGSGRLVNLAGGASCKVLNIVGCRNSGDTVATVASGQTVAPTVNLVGNDIEGAGVVSVSSNCTVTCSSGNRFLNASNGIIRFNATATVTLRSDGTNNVVAGAWVAAPAGTPTVNVYGNDITVDVGAALGFNKTTSGQYCFNNGAARGTLTQNRLVTCNGTNWVQVDTPANVF